ncbi:sigma-70 family RNA polymerase sigma factor [Aquibium oceanicum]|uniref:RNA polymerase subunit sigma n=1 Tax=Aquibium oceanicum TaxID=1670800 RepID=A0A1L3SLV6_9HYPH|nr:sigma-70 family RNA polymerase sigma factor [Aquibium oceanicum]APH70350.1 RNA polymerase subunit sigma [Aquibium oceanicum]
MDIQPEARTTTDPQEVVDLIPALRAFARTFCRDQNDADDLVQETLTKAIAKLDSFQPGTRLKSWLFTIMRNSFYNRVVVTTREAPGSEDCVSAAPACAPSQEWTVRAGEMRRAIERLPEPQKEVVLLVGLMGTSYKDAARICNCDIGTVKSRLSRSRTALLAELGEASTTSLLSTSV